MKNNKEIARMRMLAGLITEGQYKKLIKEEDYNAIDSMAPDWQDEDGYELVLDEYFDTYGLEDPDAFAEEVYNNGDAMNNLAFDIAKRAGFKGDYNVFGEDENMEFERYCNGLAKLFLLKHGAAMGSVDRNDSKYKQQLQQAENWVTEYKSKAQPTVDQLQGK
jgi:hypothetical protein